MNPCSGNPRRFRDTSIHSFAVGLSQLGRFKPDGYEELDEDVSLPFDLYFLPNSEITDLF